MEMQSCHGCGDSASSGIYDSILLQQSDNDATGSGDLLRAPDHQVYCRLKIKALLSNPDPQFANGKKRFSRVLKDTSCRVISVGILATPSKVMRNSFRISEPQQPLFHRHGWAEGPCETHKSLSEIRLGCSHVLANGFSCRRIYFARIGGARFLVNKRRDAYKWVRCGVAGYDWRRCSCRFFVMARPERHHSWISLAQHDIHA